MELGLKSTHKSKKALAYPQELSAGRVSATHLEELYMNYNNKVNKGYNA